jgi:GTP-binding protein YchF
MLTSRPPFLDMLVPRLALCNAANPAFARARQPTPFRCVSIMPTSRRIADLRGEVKVLKIGIVGLGQVGKTTLFRILTHAHGSGLASGRPEAHLGVVHVPDARLDRLVKMYPGRKTVYASVEYVDSPGSVIDLLRTGVQTANLREMDALAHVVRAFEEDTLPPPGGSVNPQRDIENVELEMILSDLAVIEKRLERLERDLKKQKDPALDKEHHVLLTCKAALEKQTPLREVALGAEEATVRGFTFLSLKPMLYVLNLGEEDAARANAADEFAAQAGLKQRPKTGVAAVSGKIEAELAELTDAEAAEFLESYGLKESAIFRLIRVSYQLLGVISFFTVGDSECRAWTIRSGATAWEAAGEVHSDFQKGFIRAEVVRFEDLVAAGSLAEARNRGVLKLEGKEYVLHDGEVVYIRHAP